MNDIPLPKNQTKKGLLIAAAPVLLLALLALGLRYLPTVMPANDEGDGSREVKELLSNRRKGVPRRPQPSQIKPKPADAETQKVVETVARGQITAISTGNFAAALTYSNANFRSGWTPEQFGTMVRNGPYEPLSRAKKQSFRPAQQAGTVCLLPLTVFDATGQKAEFMYVIGKEAQGWSVISCSRTDPPAPFNRAPELQEAPL